MTYLSQLSPIHWAWYIGAITIGGIGIFFSTQGLFGFTIDTLYILCGFAVFIVFLFAIFLLIIQKKTNMRGAPLLSFFISHASFLLLGFGLVPIALFEKVSVDRNAFFLFSPTGFLSLAIVAITIFICYFGATFFLRRIFEHLFCNKFLLKRASRNISAQALFAIGLIVLLAALMFVVSGEPLFMFGIILAPFMRFVFLIGGSTFMVPGILLTIFFLAGFILMLYASIEKKGKKKDQALFCSLIVLSKIFVGMHVVLWVCYMKAIGIAFSIGSWNPFPFLP